MLILPRLSSLWRNLFRKSRREQELTEEIDAYLEMLIEQKIDEGLNPAEARRAAHRASSDDIPASRFCSICISRWKRISSSISRSYLLRRSSEISRRQICERMFT